MPDNWRRGLLHDFVRINPSEPALTSDAPFVPMDAVEPGHRWVKYVEPRGTRAGARFRAGDTLFARITPCLENGKVAQVQPDIERGGGSTEFIVLRAGHELDPEFLYFWASAPRTRDTAKRMMAGTTGRQRLSARDLGQLPLALPPRREQRRIANLLQAFDVVLQAAELAAVRAHALRGALLDDAFSRLEPESSSRLSEMLRRERRPIEIDLAEDYRQVGIRSFGRGIFHKDAVKGRDLGNKKVFLIHEGDLLFNIVFAWEGAVAVAGRLDDGRCGSHRFPTYVPASSAVNVEYLRLFFETSAGRAALALASPGSAGRNRTLNQTSMLRTSVPFPPRRVQDEVAALLSTCELVSREARQEVEALRTARGAVAEDLLSGEHSIPSTYDRRLSEIA